MSDASDASATDVETGSEDATALPLLAAAFLIKFDLKVGYSIVWKRSIEGLEVGNDVEYKSLPSGLHNVKEDLVYFIHDEYAGLSAFVNGPASEAERNAHLVAVGVLVPLSHGRLGRVWLHAQALKELAGQLVSDTTQTQALEDYWGAHALSNSSAGQSSRSPLSSPVITRPPQLSGKARRNRALSTVTAVVPSDQSLPAAHPALSILRYIDCFGPLVFPLQRAALLRKRVLFVTSPPMRSCCEYVYDLSILTSIPSTLTPLLAPHAPSLHRIKPLFAIGIHDIPLLEKEATKHNYTDVAPPDSDDESGRGWIACTSDEVLVMKNKLYDIVVEMPTAYDHKPAKKSWPKIKTSDGKEVLATQRDLRRWKILDHELRKLRRRSSTNPPVPEDIEEGSDDRSPLIRNEDEEDDEEEIRADEVVEPTSWSALAYNGFMWWASAGERDASLAEEYDRDRSLLGDLSDFAPHGLHPNGKDGDITEGTAMERSLVDLRGTAAPQTAVIAFFHRITSSILSELAGTIEAADDSSDAEMDDESRVFVGDDEMRRMGLDVWSAPDKRFVEECTRLWFGREVDVEGGRVECCGVRIC